MPNVMACGGERPPAVKSAVIFMLFFSARELQGHATATRDKTTGTQPSA